MNTMMFTMMRKIRKMSGGEIVMMTRMEKMVMKNMKKIKMKRMKKTVIKSMKKMRIMRIMKMVKVTFIFSTHLGGGGKEEDPKAECGPGPG